MKVQATLDNLLSKSNGTIKVSQALEAGISKPAFYEYVKRNNLENANNGIYYQQHAWSDYLYFLHLRCKQAVFSHETALYLHELTDREPFNYSVTVITGYNPTNLKKDGVKVYSVKKELHHVGLTLIKTNFNNDVPVYDLERTVCDIIRSRNSMDYQVFQDTLKNYLKRRDKNLKLLMEYAALFRVKNVLKKYLEVLL